MGDSDISQSEQDDRDWSVFNAYVYSQAWNRTARSVEICLTCDTASNVVKGAGSVGLALFYWVIGYLMASSSLSVYMEFASCFPSRSGSEVVYLEQSYPRPKYFFPTVFAMQTVLFSFSSSNAVGMFIPVVSLNSHIDMHISLGTIPLQTGRRRSYAVETEGSGRGFLYSRSARSVTIDLFLTLSMDPRLICMFRKIVLAFNTRWSLRLANAIGLVKLITLVL